MKALTVTLQGEFDVAQGSSVLQEVSGCIRQDVVRLGSLEEELQFHAMLPGAWDHS